MNVLVYFNKVLFMYSKVTLSFQHKAASNRPAFHTLGEKKKLFDYRKRFVCQTKTVVMIPDGCYIIDID